MSFFKKALSVFVEMDESPTPATPTSKPTSANQPPQINQQPTVPSTPIPQADLGKFVKHFEQLFEKTNLPGPDYYEFWKMMDTLEAHIPDENARMQAVFATLGLQGMTKVTLLDTASKYKEEVLRDKANFEAAVQQKSDAEIAGRRSNIQSLETEAGQKNQQIAQLQKEIAAATAKIDQLQQEIAAEESKINASKQGYLTACGAMISKIDQDMQSFQRVLS
jgi:predicted nuclease with TOPRIM domain